MVPQGFPDRLREARNRQVWSQGELADLTAGLCCRRTVQNYEGGHSAPRIGSKQLTIIASLLRMDPDELLFGKKG